MRKLLWLVAIAAALWSGYWFVAAQGIERGLTAWFGARAAENWQAETSGISVTGFPFRFDVTLSEPALADPETGLAWAAPQFRFGAPAHTPTRVTAIWPADQTLSSPFERVAIASEAMTAGLGLVLGPSLTLDTADASLDDVTFSGASGWTTAIAEGSLTTRRRTDDPLAHDIRFAARGLSPAKQVLVLLDPAGLLPETIAALELDATAAFDRDWDRRAIEERRPQLTALTLDRLLAQWGEMSLAAAGALDVDPSGIPEGRVTVRAVNWRDMIAVLRSAGAIPEGIVPTVERALSLLAGLSGNPDTIDVPLSFQNGFMSLGPVPLGPAPRLVIR